MQNAKRHKKVQLQFFENLRDVSDRAKVLTESNRIQKNSPMHPFMHIAHCAESIMMY